ncbi:MAG: transglutaminase-like domain-containing protein [bacterium]
MRLRIVPLTIMAAWLVMVGLLVKREYLTAEPAYRPGAVRGDTTATEQWNGIYLQGRKIGYGYTRRSSLGDSLWRVTTDQVMRITALGRSQVISTRSEATLNRDFSLRSFLVSMSTDDALSSLTAPVRRRGEAATSFEAQGGVDGSKIRLVTRQGGEREGREQTIPIDGPVYMDVGPRMLLAGEGLREGRTITVPTFDPVSMRVSSTQIRVAGRDTLRIGGDEVPAWRLESEFMGLTLTSWVDSEGNEVRATAPLGIRIDTEPREVALEQGWDDDRALDLVNLAAVPAGVMKIEGARQVDSMTVRLEGIEHGDFEFTFGRQELIEELVEVRVEDTRLLADYEMPSRERVLRRWLEPSPFVQSDDRRIERRMRIIRGNTTSAREYVERLVGWVYGYLEKQPSAGLPNAVEVLSRRAGDCNEHTVLFTALARAAGVPTQMNVGVVYLDGSFYYHAWPTVWVGQWVAVDPTFDQFPADATHISFLRGDLDRQMELLKVIGRVRIDVVSYHPGPGGGEAP